MVPVDRRTLRTVEVALALLVLGIVAMLALQLDPPYPSWPTVAGVAVDPELVIPGLLAVVALLGAVEDGLGIASVVVAVLAVATGWMAATGIYSLTTRTAGGVFWAGFFTLVLGTLLAFAVLARVAVRELVRRGGIDRLRRELAGT